MANENDSPDTIYHRAGVRRAAEQLMKSEVGTARARALLYEKIESAYGRVRMKDLVRASGLTRQRIHQILDERKERGRTQ